MPFELVENVVQNAVIKVIGVGGGGGNAVRHMIESNVEGVEFICANTDAQALNKALDNCTVLKIGGGITKGLGAGANPEVGRQSALEDRERIAEVLRGADMVFITAGMGGGTGTGAAPVVAQVARELGILTVAVVTKPFQIEGKKRLSVAQQGLNELAENVDSLITISNEKLLTTMDKNTTSMLDAFKAANDVLLGAVQGIAELIINDGMINVDFADVRTVMSEMGVAMMGTGKASGEGRARMAAEAAIRCPLLDNVDLQGARGILVNITGGFDLAMGEFEEVGNAIREFASDNATVVIGTVLNPDISDELRVTVVATGLGQKAAAAEVKPTKVVDNTIAPPVLTPAVGATAAPNYEELDRPAVMRQRGNYGQQPYGSMDSGYGGSRVSAAACDVSALSAGLAADKLDYLDVPAFLRRQAD